MKQHDIVSCYRMNRQDNLIRKFNGSAWTTLVRFAFSLKVRDVDCAFKLYRRDFRRHQMDSTGAAISTEILACRAKGLHGDAEVCTTTRERPAGRPVPPRVIFLAFRELLKLRRRIWLGSRHAESEGGQSVRLRLAS
jgi:hypothetical protein